MTRIECFSLDAERARANALLKSGEALPESVSIIIDFCTERGLGFILSRNVAVFTCKDARSNRVRLGHTGIPLFDELKSIVFKGVDKNGNEKIVATHLRGHMAIDRERIVEVCGLGEMPDIMPEEELTERFGMQFGTVNPMLIEVRSGGSITNVFDESLTKPMAELPGTMMTNAGNHTWGIELDPALLIKAIRGSVVSSFAVPDKELKLFEVPQSANPKSIGIITGNGPDSGIALWNTINSYFVDLLDGHFLGDISLPKVSVVSLPAMGLSMELDRRDDATWATLCEAIDKLKANDVDLLALACHTTHYYTEKIRERFERDGKRFISMAETTIDYIKKANLSDLAVLGINFVAEMGKYSAYSELKNLEIEDVKPETLAKFHDLGYAVKKMKDIHVTFMKFSNLLKTEIKAKNVVIALTELSILYGTQKKKGDAKNVIDPLDIYAKELTRQSLSLKEGETYERLVDVGIANAVNNPYAKIEEQSIRWMRKNLFVDKYAERFEVNTLIEPTTRNGHVESVLKELSTDELDDLLTKIVDEPMVNLSALQRRTAESLKLAETDIYLVERLAAPSPFRQMFGFGGDDERVIDISGGLGGFVKELSVKKQAVELLIFYVTDENGGGGIDCSDLGQMITFAVGCLGNENIGIAYDEGGKVAGIENLAKALDIPSGLGQIEDWLVERGYNFDFGSNSMQINKTPEPQTTDSDQTDNSAVDEFALA